jgi:hypothetical protein
MARQKGVLTAGQLQLLSLGELPRVSNHEFVPGGTSVEVGDRTFLEWNRHRRTTGRNPAPTPAEIALDKISQAVDATRIDVSDVASGYGRAVRDLGGVVDLARRAGQPNRVDRARALRRDIKTDWRGVVRDEVRALGDLVSQVGSELWVELVPNDQPVRTAARLAPLAGFCLASAGRERIPHPDLILRGNSGQPGLMPAGTQTLGLYMPG